MQVGESEWENLAQNLQLGLTPPLKLDWIRVVKSGDTEL